MNEKEIKDLLNTIEDQIPDDYCRSYDSADGLCHTWPDEDSWQYKTLKYIKQLQQENQQLKEKLLQREIELNDCMNERNEFVGIIEETIKELKRGLTFCVNDSQGAYDICNIAIKRNKDVLDILNKYKGDNNE